MRKLICVLLLLAGLSTAMAEGFTFENGITWDTTVEEALASLGENAVSNREAWGDHASATMVGIEHTQCLGLDCERLMLFFFNDRLCTISAYYTKDDLNGDLQTLTDALSASYGEPEYPNPEVKDLSDFLFEQFSVKRPRKVCDWQPDEVTQIELTDTSGYEDADEEPYPYTAFFCIFNGPVYDDMNDAVDAFMDSLD